MEQLCTAATTLTGAAEEVVPVRAGQFLHAVILVGPHRQLSPQSSFAAKHGQPNMTTAKVHVHKMGSQLWYANLTPYQRFYAAFLVITQLRLRETWIFLVTAREIHHRR